MNITQPRMKTNVCSKQTAARIELPAPYNQCASSTVPIYFVVCSKVAGGRGCVQCSHGGSLY